MKTKYRKMLNIMKEKEDAGQVADCDEWLLYILECNDGSFYTGVTKDLKRRLKMHNKGNASRYTRSRRRPVELIYSEQCAGRAQALKRECSVKSLTREKKEMLVNKRF